MFRYRVPTPVATDPPNPYAPPRAPDVPPVATFVSRDRGHRYASLWPAAATITAAVSALVVVNLISVVSTLRSLVLFGKGEDYLLEHFADLKDIQTFNGRVGIARFLVSAVVVVASCFFMVRANKNARAFGATPLKFTPGWAAGSFFVPVVWWFWPYQAVAEAWRAADVEHQTPWQQVPVPLLLPLWWGGWILQSTLGALLPVLEGQPTELAQFATAVRIGLVPAAISLATAVLFIVVVRTLAARHARKAEELGRAAA
jgi:hypothetical protein